MSVELVNDSGLAEKLGAKAVYSIANLREWCWAQMTPEEREECERNKGRKQRVVVRDGKLDFEYEA